MPVVALLILVGGDALILAAKRKFCARVENTPPEEEDCRMLSWVKQAKNGAEYE